MLLPTSILTTYYLPGVPPICASSHSMLLPTSILTTYYYVPGVPPICASSHASRCTGALP
eukprot:scaffold95603_cov35-Phaeocystis_antarctica.AAC.1